MLLTMGDVIQPAVQLRLQAMEDGWWSECHGKPVNIVLHKYSLLKTPINATKT